MTANKVRIRFRKAGDLRFLSHHDLMRLWERLLRRAAIPFRSSEGFHPLPKMAFASALGLGIIGDQEVIEIELAEDVAPEEVHRRLTVEAPLGLTLLSAQAVPRKQTAQVRRACYLLPLDPAAHPELPARIAELFAQTECWVERRKPQPRKVNIRPYLRTLTLADDGLTLDLAVTPQGAARPEEVLQLLGLGDLLANGAVLARTVLELHDEEARSP